MDELFRVTFRKLKPSQRAGFKRMLDRDELMPHALAVAVGLTYAKAYAVLLELAQLGFRETRILLYHNCEPDEPDVPVAVVPLKDGLPELPWRCPRCRRRVKREAELSHDISSRKIRDVRLR